MTVSELIARLRELPGNSRVVIRGYEYGQTDIDLVEPVELYLHYHGEEPTYGGPHEIRDPKDSIETSFELVKAVKLSKENRPYEDD